MHRIVYCILLSEFSRALQPCLLLSKYLDKVHVSLFFFVIVFFRDNSPDLKISSAYRFGVTDSLFAFRTAPRCFYVFNLQYTAEAHEEKCCPLLPG